jgi:CHAT domain-containing protein
MDASAPHGPDEALALARAALSAYHAAHPKDQEELLCRAFEALIAAAGHLASSPEASWTAALLALLVELYDEDQGFLYSDTSEAQRLAWLHQLAALVEAYVPVEFADPRGAGQTSALARKLADISYLAGTRKLADARSAFAITVAEQGGAAEAWFEALFARYGRLKGSGGLASLRLSGAATIDDLEAWINNLPAPPNDRQAQLDELRAQLNIAAAGFRRSFRSRAGRLWAAQQIAAKRQEILEDLLSGEADSAELFSTVDSLKAQLLLDYLEAEFREPGAAETLARGPLLEGQVLAFAPEDPEDTASLLHHEMRLASPLPIGFFDDDERRAPLEALEALYAAEGAGFQSAAEVASLDAIVAALGPGEALIEYHLHGDPAQKAHLLNIFVLTAGGLQVLRFRVPWPAEGAVMRFSFDDRQPLDYNPLAAQVVELRLAIQRGDDPAAWAQLEQLYELLVAPLVAMGLRPQDYERWIIVPHEMLHCIPFCALRPSGGRSLIEELALSVVPSASVWQSIHERARPAPASFVGFANPLLLDGRWPALPETEEELAQIRARLAGLSYAGYSAEEATEARVEREAPGKSILHFATHGAFPESDVIDLHQILLTPEGERDGRLHAEELRQMDLRAARLVALSVCNGGLYRIGPGDEPYGLIAALLTAGAEHVLGTLWPIEDRSGREFVVELYAHLLEHGPAEAWRRACRAFIAAGRPLGEWAAWVVIGAGRPWETQGRPRLREQATES